MNLSPNEIGDKFELVLNGLLNHDFNVTNDVYLEMLISHLSGKNGEDYSKLLAQPFIQEWIAQSFQQISSEKPQNLQVFAFSLQLIALLLENERYFKALEERRILDVFLENLHGLPKLQSPSIKLANILIFQSMTKHSSGVIWLREKKSWKVAVQYCMQNQTIYVVRKALEFTTDFLFRCHDDDNLCVEVLGDIMRPLDENVFAEDIGRVLVDCYDLQQKVVPTINFIICILDRFVRTCDQSLIAHHIYQTFKGKVNLWKLTDMTQDPIFFNKILSCHVYINYSILLYALREKHKDKSTPVSESDFNEFGLTCLNELKFCILKNQFLAILTIARLYYVLWRSLGDRVPEEIMIGTQKVKFENQIILFQILPILVVMRTNSFTHNEITGLYFTKIFDISSEHTMRIAYSFRDSLRRNNANVPDIAYKAIQNILSMECVLHRDRAVIVFQALIHTVKGFAVQEDFNTIVEQQNLVAAILTGLHSLVKKFRLTWQDTFETICLLNFSLMILQQANLSSRLVVQALKLTQLSLEHFLPPNLALLVDTLNGSDLVNLGPMILKRLHDNHWEVRDSTLELLSAIASISMIKFPAFQEHIQTNGLCQIVVQIAKYDCEAYVRASALNCLCSMVNVKLFWEHSLSSLNLTTHLTEVVHTECEGVVRKEAVALIIAMYETQRVPSNQLDCVFSTMAYCAVNDLHWEVKTKALEFWEVFMKRQFQHHGVIDGGFPAATFSKEKKKIITLTQKEITLRLSKILNELSARGCLGVLLACINDESDLSVVKATLCVIKNLTEFLQKYDYKDIEVNQPPDSGASSPVPGFVANCSDSVMTEIIESPVLTQSEINDSEEVIQSIVSAQDINLLALAYENQLNIVENNNEPAIDADYFKTFSNITASLFLRKVNSTDLGALLKCRTDWMAHTESFGSLLNDMLYSLKIDDVNDADCY